MPKNGVHFIVFIANSESCEFYEVRGFHAMTGFLAVFVVGSLKAAMKFAMKFYRAVRGIVVSKSREEMAVVPFPVFLGRYLLDSILTVSYEYALIM